MTIACDVFVGAYTPGSFRDKLEFIELPVIGHHIVMRSFDGKLRSHRVKNVYHLAHGDASRIALIVGEGEFT